MGFSGGSDRIVYEEQPQGSAGPPLPLSQANGGLGTDASALANGVLVKAGGVFATSTAPTMSGANISAASVPAAKITGGTLGRLLYDDSAGGAWTAVGTTGWLLQSNGGVIAPSFTNVIAGITISGASNTITNLPTSSIAPTFLLTAANGGTGKATWTVGSIPVASGVTTIAEIAPGTAGQVLTSNGAGVAPSMQAPAADTVVSAKFSGTYLVAATTFANVGLPLVLPVGKWRVVFEVRNLTVVSAGEGFARLRLYDSTSAAVIADSETQGILTTGTAGGTTTITMDINIVGGAKTIDLQAARDTVATYSACQVIGDSDGWTRATAFLRAA